MNSNIRLSIITTTKKRNSFGFSNVGFSTYTLPLSSKSECYSQLQGQLQYLCPGENSAITHLNKNTQISSLPKQMSS